MKLRQPAPGPPKEIVLTLYHEIKTYKTNNEQTWKKKEGECFYDRVSCIKQLNDTALALVTKVNSDASGISS